MKLRELKTNTSGRMYLHSMPGRKESMGLFIDQVERCGITEIICLASEEEVSSKSPEYASALAANRIPAKRVCFPVPDFGIPEDIPAFYALARKAAQQLQDGQSMLAHCVGGVGRTGTFAGCVLKALGLPLTILERSGSGPGTEAQANLVERFEH